MTRERQQGDGGVIRQFHLASVVEVLGAFLGAAFLVLYLLAFLPWVLVRGTTAAVEGLMNRVGFGDFSADTIWSWLLVLVVGAAFVAFLVALLAALLALYNLLSHRTGYGLRVGPEVASGAEPLAVTAGESQSDPVSDEDATYDELYGEAQRRNVTGRSSMSTAELEAALKPKRRRPRKGAVKARKTPAKRRR